MRVAFVAVPRKVEIPTFVGRFRLQPNPPFKHYTLDRVAAHCRERSVSEFDPTIRQRVSETALRGLARN